MAKKQTAAKRKAVTPAAKKRAQLQRVERANGLKREKFCQHYVLTQNATESYQVSHGTKARPIQDNTAATAGWRLLRNSEIHSRLKELRIQGHDHLMVSFEETLQEIGGLAMFDPKDMFDDAGRVLPIHEMPIVARKMIHEFEQLRTDGTNEDGVITSSRYDTKIKYGKDKGKYLDMIMKFYNAYELHQKAGGGIINVQMYCAQDANL
jgi:phage terminase small subunit